MFWQIIWPSAGRAYELLNGVKLGSLNPVIPPTASHDRHKRHAEDAFGQDRTPDYPVRQADRQVEDSGQNVDGVQDMASKLMAHMLGLDIPGVEPSTSFYTGCDWWARPNSSADSSQQNWPQAASTSAFTPLNMPSQRGWQTESRDGRAVGPYNEGYQFDHLGV